MAAATAVSVTVAADVAAEATSQSTAVANAVMKAANDGSHQATFITNKDGVRLPLSQSRLRQGYLDAGYDRNREPCFSAKFYDSAF
jgi:hypothetical protein